MVRRVGGGRENRRDMGVAHLQVHTTNLDNAIILWVVGLVGVCGVAGQATTTTPSGTTTVAYAIGDGPPPLSANCTGNSVTAEGILQGTRRYASISVRYDTTAVVNVTWTVQNPVALQGGSVEFVSRSGLYTINVGATTEVQDTFTFNQTGTPPAGPALQTLCRLSIGVVRVETTVTSTTSTASSRTTSSTTISSTTVTSTGTSTTSTASSTTISTTQTGSWVYQGARADPLSKGSGATVDNAVSPRLRGIVLFWLVTLLLLVLALMECIRYRRKFATYEVQRADGGLAARLPIPPDRDLRAMPMHHRGYCVWRCGVHCYRQLLDRCAVGGSVLFKGTLCAIDIFPGRLERVAYAVSIVSLSMAVCSAFAIWGEGPFPRQWARELHPASSNSQIVTVVTSNTTVTFANSELDTYVGSRVVVDGVADGVWAALFILPVAALLSFVLAKRAAYADIIRLIAPVRFRATMAPVRAAMEKRGVPVKMWINQARAHPSTLDNDPIAVQPRKEVYTTSNPTFAPADLTTEPQDRAWNDQFFDGGYLEMAVAGDTELRDFVGSASNARRPATHDSALGWGTDSVMGDAGVSGAREAEPIDPDSDSLMEWHGDNQYAAEFTPMVEELVWRWGWWQTTSKGFSVVSILLGLAGSIFVLFLRDDFNRDDRDRFYTGVIVCSGLLLVLWSLVLLVLLAAWQACSDDEVGTSDNTAVDIPTCRNLFLKRMVY